MLIRGANLLEKRLVPRNLENVFLEQKNTHASSPFSGRATPLVFTDEIEYLPYGKPSQNPSRRVDAAHFHFFSIITSSFPGMARVNRFGFLAIAMAFHVIYIYSIFDIYFVSPIVSGMREFETIRPENVEAPAKRLVLFVGTYSPSYSY